MLLHNDSHDASGEDRPVVCGGFDVLPLIVVATLLGVRCIGSPPDFALTKGSTPPWLCSCLLYRSQSSCSSSAVSRQFLLIVRHVNGESTHELSLCRTLLFLLLLLVLLFLLFCCSCCSRRSRCTCCCCRWSSGLTLGGDTHCLFVPLLGVLIKFLAQDGWK